MIDKNKLIDAINSQNQPEVELLLKTGEYNVNIPDGNGILPINVAIKTSSIPMVSYLIERNANLNIVVDIPPLHCAVKTQYEKMVNLLIDGKADVNYQDPKGNTPLHFGMKSGNLGIMLLLLNKGANAYITNNIGIIPMHYFPNQLRFLGDGNIELYNCCDSNPNKRSGSNEATIGI